MYVPQETFLRSNLPYASFRYHLWIRNFRRFSLFRSLGPRQQGRSYFQAHLLTFFVCEPIEARWNLGRQPSRKVRTAPKNLALGDVQVTTSQDTWPSLFFARDLQVPPN